MRHLSDAIWRLSLMFVDEGHGKLPTLYWSPTLHKKYKSRFIANSSSCTTTKLNIYTFDFLPHCDKNHSIKYFTTVYDRNGKNVF